MNNPSPASETRSVVWSRRDQVSLEYFAIHRTTHEVRLAGTIITLHDGEPLRVEYTVQCDRSWATRSVRIGLTSAGVSSELALLVDDHRRWWRDGQEVTAVAGCVDVDINLTPSTNTLPIRRLSLARGAASDVVAAWIRLPEMAIEPLPQRYERTGELTYHYSSAGGAFTTDIEVDDLGLVVRYPPAWERASP